ncbi:uncharacterized protein TRIADDRAFT_23088 [Trichoplax adhaerens]|uniref:Protein fem-1 homolog B n=1 Tax=Trichoplax adhaerens TaxID=10228 RepID=B3RT10_TRIAD|nr:hypothetical protein TRIADDRAFT_23088 [Trichoplax adhaerens]EDV26614.1 hypothetical protein TRIADDRAFT_23088 [Trichoplax adhaerens]|eukprot:XP_002110610.1 hypothetical protein TRIADDRAFT_23088 [Trichoplax adhaerens]
MSERKLWQIARKCPQGAKQFIQNLPISYRANFEKSTVRCHPLQITAALHEYSDILSILVKHYKLDLEEECDIFIKKEKVQGATALWIACLRSHFPSIKILIQNGAQINHATRHLSTPLRVACSAGNRDIVRYLIDHGADPSIATVKNDTCLMTACRQGYRKIATMLLKRGVNVNAQTVSGKTALHECATSGSIRICKLLLKYGAIPVPNHFNTTPLMHGALSGHSLFVKWYITRRKCLLSDKCKALILLGCTAADKLHDLAQALHCWRTALTMWQDTKDQQRSVSNLISTSKPLPAYDYITIIRGAADIDRLSINPDHIRMQSLALRECIIGDGHPSTQYYIRVRGAMYGDSEQLLRCWSLWLYALDLQQQYMPIADPAIEKSFVSFLTLFQRLIINGTSFPIHILIAVCRRILQEISLISICLQRDNPNKLKALSRPPISDNFSVDRFMSICLHLIRCWLDIQSEVNSERDKFTAALLNIDIVTYDNKQTFLHLVVSADPMALQYNLREFPCLYLVEYLIAHCNAEVNVLDCNKNSPLHLSCSTAHLYPVNFDIISLLLKYGSHFDIRNSSGYTAYDKIVDINVKRLLRKQCLPSLLCLTSSAIVKNNVNYKNLPSSLTSFIGMH